MGLRQASLSDILSSGQYHSALISTYTIDPVFTKTILIPLLQSNRVRNTTILSDRKELRRALYGEEILSILQGSSFLLLPAKTRQLFHPKVMLFVGEKTGLCVIGSGNLTHSGMGGNNEVWGAYHFSPENQQNARVFRDVWEFLQSYNPSISGVGSEKSRDWILNHSQWLSDIVSGQAAIEEAPVEIFINKEKPIWDNFLDKIKGKELRQIIVISPFYDKKAEMVRTLKESFPNIPVNLIYDDFGTVPKLDESIDSVHCYNWKDIASNNGNIGSNKLHAKAIIAVEQNQKEHILFGSPNMTQAGLGVKRPGNIELAVYSESNGMSYHKELGISFVGVDSKPINKIHSTSLDIDEPSIDNSINSPVVLYAEQKADELTIDFDEDAEGQSIGLYLSDQKGNLLFDKPKMVESKKGQIIRLNEKDPVPEISFIEDSENKSRYLVYQVSKLNVDNPDPKSATIRNALSEISKSSFGNLYDLFTELFDSLAVDKLKQKESKSGRGTRSEENGEAEDDETFYKREELEDKQRGKESINLSSDYISDGLFAIIKLLDEQWKEQDTETVEIESTATDSSDQLDTDEVESDAPEQVIVEKIEEARKKKNGYQRYIKKAIGYYAKADEILGRADNHANHKFITNWLLVNSVALHTIKTDLKKQPFEVEDGLDQKTTILPYQKKGELTIDEISTKLVMGIVGRLSMDTYKISIEDYLEPEKRLTGAVKMLEIIHLKHWSEPKNFIKACSFIMSLFKVQEGNLIAEFQDKFRNEISFYDEAIMENDWRYYRHISKNLAVSEPVTMNELTGKL